jgi:DNA repair photolyase
MKLTNIFSEDNRVFVSFGGKCPFQCLHCYTFSQNFKTEDFFSIEDIISNLKRKDKFDTIYVSGYRENFENPNDGLDLVEALFSEFKCHILFTTRNVFSEEHILRVSNLNKLMRESNKFLFACVSISAYNSYRQIEPNNKIPSPDKRIEFLKQLYDNDIITFLTLRPIYPDLFIPTKEYLEILEKSYKFCNAVIASGLCVDDYIVERLKTFPKDCVSKSEVWAYFNMEVREIDVSKELSEIETFCKEKVLVFEGSIPAMSHFYNQQQK